MIYPSVTILLHFILYQVGFLSHKILAQFISTMFFVFSFVAYFPPPTELHSSAQVKYVNYFSSTRICASDSMCVCVCVTLIKLNCNL